MPETVEIGLGRSARRGFHLDDIALVPTRRTRGSSVVSTTWQIDAHTFDLPLVAAPSDAVVSPDTAREIERLGGLAVLDGEGLWARYEDAGRRTREARRRDHARCSASTRSRSTPNCSAARVADLRAGGGRVAVRLSPQHTADLAPHVLAAGVDLLVLQGTIISAEHVAAGGPGLNLKTFIADLDVPVIVGGVTNYQTALHLMRTGAAGVIVGYGAHLGATTHSMLGIDVPMATALVDAAAARRDYLDETGGRYVHLIGVRRHAHRRRHREGARLRRGRGDARPAAGDRRRGARATGGTGTPPRRTRASRAAPSIDLGHRPGERPTARGVDRTARRPTRPASATCSARYAG